MKSLKSDFGKEVVFFSGVESRIIPGYVSAYAGADGKNDAPFPEYSDEEIASSIKKYPRPER